jgi:ketosteroid isomerase-like protein
MDANNKANSTEIMRMISNKSGVTYVGDGIIKKGWDAIRTETEKFISTERRYSYSTDTIDITPLGAGFSLVVATYTVTFETLEGTKQVRGAMTLILEKSKGEWKIIHEHTSPMQSSE